MIKGTIVLNDMSSLHLRPATNLSKIANEYKCSIKLTSGNISANVKSIISLLGACVKFGETVELVCDGEDELEAFEGVKCFLENFGEESLKEDI